MSDVPPTTRGTSRDSSGAPPATAGGGRRDASMLLLTALVEDSLDQGYARAAARKAAGEPPSRSSRWVLAAGLLAVGLLLTTAAVEARARSSSVAEARAALTAEIGDRESANADLERSLERQRAAVAREREESLQLTSEGARLSDALTTLEAAAGAAAVRGPGMVVRLTDAQTDPTGADVDPRAGEAGEGRVTDRDMQTVVNEIWASGAEAVAINEQRLTALSAIRAAGEAILVDFRPLNPPYVVAAVGPPSMRTAFVEGFGGSYLQVLRDYGIQYAVQDSDDLQLPASAGLAVRYAVTPADVPSGASVPQPQKERTP